MNFKTPLIVIILSIVLLAFFSCADNIDSTNLPLDEEVILPYQETLDIESTNLTITIDSIEESRCPNLIDCVWAGVVIVYFTTESTDGSQNFSLCLSADAAEICENYIEMGNYSYQLVTVNPYPDEIIPTSFENHEATLIISEI